MKRIFFVHGDKGGVGKTEAAKRFAAVMLEAGKSITLIDGDNKNPGLHAAFKDSNVDVLCINVMKSAGLDHLFEVIAESTCDIMIDLPARGSDVTERLASGGASENGFDLGMLTEELGAEIYIIFVIDQTRAPVVALKAEFEALPASTKWIIIKNHKEERAFDLFNESKVRKDLEHRGAPIIDMIRLDPKVCDIMENNGLNLVTARQSDQLSMLQKLRAKSALRSWAEQMRKAGLI